MTDTPPTKEQLKAQKTKLMLASMKSAKDNMASALHRIDTLESCIANLVLIIDSMMEFVPAASYPYNCQDSHQARFKKAKSNAMVNI